MKKIVSALLVSVAALSAPAYAVGFDDNVVGSKYAVVDLGSISYGGNSATSISVGGGYQVLPAVAVEVDYLMGGKYSYANFGFTGFETSMSGLQIQAVGNYNFGNGFSAYGKAGLAFNSFKTSYLAFNGVNFYAATATASSTDLTFSIGAKYNVTKDIALRAQYQETGVSSVSVLSVGAMFNF